jgi:hypothetical protein
MMQKQIAFEEKTKEEHSPLSLMDISPTWARRFEKQQQQLPIPLSFTWLRWYFEIVAPSKCVVGEAYGFSSSYTYNCSECGKIGSMFSLHFAIRSYKKLEQDKLRFIKHWNDKHIHIDRRQDNY